MKLSEKLTGAIATGRTFAASFWPWLLWAAIAGGAVMATPTFLLTKAWYQRATLKLEARIAKEDAALATERAETLRLSQELSAAVLENRDAERNRLDAVAADLRSLGSRVQLCATKSDVRVTVTPTGAIQAVPDGQLRDLADAVREFAEACAIQRDRDAIDHNALIDWLQKLQRK